jgi:hypothetical protein
MCLLRHAPGFALLSFATLAALPTAPTAERLAELRAMSELNPRLAAESTPLTVDPSSREEVRQFFRAVYTACANPPIGWTGNFPATNPVTAAGDTTAMFKEPTRVRINFFRALAGLPATIALNATFTQVAAFPSISPASREAAILATLAPGSCTAQVTGVAGSSGLTLAEVYEVPREGVENAFCRSAPTRDGSA